MTRGVSSWEMPAWDVGSRSARGQLGGQSGWVNKAGVEKWAIEGYPGR